MNKYKYYQHTSFIAQFEIKEKRKGKGQKYM